MKTEIIQIDTTRMKQGRYWCDWCGYVISIPCAPLVSVGEKHTFKCDLKVNQGIRGMGRIEINVKPFEIEVYYP